MMEPLTVNFTFNHWVQAEVVIIFSIVFVLMGIYKTCQIITDLITNTIDEYISKRYGNDQGGEHF